MTTTLHAASPGPHAVVVGAGPTGLAVADALGRHLERVTLIERDDIPDHGTPGDSAVPDPPAAALRRVLHAARIVVRPGLEVVALVFRPGRVLGVEVLPRRGGGRAPVTIPADLVVDTTGWRHDPLVGLPDGLIVAGRATLGGDDGAAGGDGAGGRRRAAIRAERAAATLGRCLDDHLAGHTGLAGFSTRAQWALDGEAQQSRPRLAPAGPALTEPAAAT